MTSVKPLAARLAHITLALQPPEHDNRLPHIIWADYEAHNLEHERLAQRRGLHPKLYLFDPNNDGIEP